MSTTNRILLAKGPNGSNLDQIFAIKNNTGDTSNNLILKNTYDLSANISNVYSKVAVDYLIRDQIFASNVITMTNKTLTSAVLNTGVSGTAVLDEDNMASNSNTQLATQQSIKAFVTSGTVTMTNKTLTSAVLNTGVSGTAVLDEDNMASNSDTKLATQQSIKAFVTSGTVTMTNKT